MTPIDRYLERVSFWLPARKRADILADLRGLLLDRIEAAEAATDHPLDEDEQRRLLATMEPPVVLAARYVEQRPVISGMLAFFYWRVLALAGVVIAGIHTLIFCGEAAQARSPAELGLAATDWVRGGGLALLVAFASVTLIFFLIDSRRRRLD
jgi:hypothetical protein